MHANCILDILYKRITFNLHIFILLPTLITCIQFGLLLRCIPSCASQLVEQVRTVQPYSKPRSCAVQYKFTGTPLCVEWLSLHVVSAVQDNCVDSELLKLASEDRVSILELAGECFL